MAAALLPCFVCAVGVVPSTRRCRRSGVRGRGRGCRHRRASAGLAGATAEAQPRVPRGARLAAETLAEHAWHIHCSKLASVARDAPTPAARTLTILGGAPGSGKSTVAACAQQLLNERARSAHFCKLVPMDGFHYYRTQLDAFPDPQAAHARRGAPFTFDAPRFVRCVRALREHPHRTHYLPAFEHGVKDPVEDAIAVTPAHRIVIVEGNYVLLPEAPWNELRQLAGLAALLACSDEHELARRVAARHQRALQLSYEDALRRARSNDLANARLAASDACRMRADLVIGADGEQQGQQQEEEQCGHE